MRRIARTLVILFAAALGLAPPAVAPAASSPRVELLVVGRSRVLTGPRLVRARATTVAVGRRRCAVAAGTALAALEAARRARGPAYRLRDYGSCSRRAADAGSLFVTRIGPDGNRRADGWVYKVGRRVPGAGAADPTARRLRSGQRLTWFFCRQQPTGGCQRTLEVTLSTTRPAPGAPVRAVVRGYDDEGRGIAIPGVTVTLAGQSAVTGPDGSATLTAPAAPGRYRIAATRAGLVPGFGPEVTVG